MKLEYLLNRAMQKGILLVLIAVLMGVATFAQSKDSIAWPNAKELARRAIAKSMQLKIRDVMIEKSKLDKKKAYEAYLPRITAEASYTRLNNDIVFPENLQQLLMGTQQLLIKEQVAMSMAPMAIPDAAKVNFTTPYTVSATDPATTPLANALAQNMQAIPPIQGKDITKVNISAQMLLFSGFKVPYSLKAADHQEAAMRLMSESEQMSIINQVVVTYDKLAVLHQSEEVLGKTEHYLNEQKRFVEKAFNNGLTINLNREKVNLAIQQLALKRIELTSNKQLLFSRLEELTGFSADSAANLNPELNEWIFLNFDGSSMDRPDIKAIDEGIMATNFKRKAELSEYVPKIVAVGKKELYKKDLSMLDPEWYVGVGLRWNIFDGFTAHNSARQVKMDRKILEYRKQEALELSDLNLKRISYDIQKNTAMIQTNKKQVEISEEILKLSQKQFEQGLITLNEHLTAVNDYEKARLDYIQAIAQERSSVVEYLAASGKLNLESLK
jgi:outer membrane protein TolC